MSFVFKDDPINVLATLGAFFKSHCELGKLCIGRICSILFNDWKLFQLSGEGPVNH